jgi:hypothetical protein
MFMVPCVQQQNRPAAPSSDLQGKGKPLLPLNPNSKPLPKPSTKRGRKRKGTTGFFMQRNEMV